MKDLEKFKEKQENFERKLEEKKENFQKKLQSKKEKLQNSLKTKQEKEASKKLLPPMFEMLVVVVNRGRGQVLLNYLKSIDLDLSIVSFGEGTAPSSIAGLLGFTQEKEVIFSVVNIKDSETILNLLDSIFLSTEKYFGIAFTIPLKSMTNNSLETLNAQNTLNHKGGK